MRVTETPSAAIFLPKGRSAIGLLSAGRMIKPRSGLERLLGTVVEAGVVRVVEDALRAETMHPLARALNPPVRFFAGAPLKAANGYVIGALAVMSPEPRSLLPSQEEALEVIGRQIVAQRDLRESIRAHEATEERLRWAEARYRSIFENASMGIFRTTLEGRYVMANQKLAEIYGYPSPQALIRSVRNIASDIYVDQDKREEFVRLIHEKGEVVDFESRVRRRDGKIIWVSENAWALRDERGRVAYYEGAVQDITARRDSEALYQSLVNSLPLAIFRKDIKGRFTFVNPVFCKLLGKDKEEILGRRDHDFYEPALADSYRADDQWVMETGKTLERTEENISPQTGKKLYVHVIKAPLYNSAGRLIGVQGIFWDETKRHEAEQELARERALLQALLNNTQDSIYFKDRKSRFRRCSAAMAKLFNVESPAELVGKTDRDFFTAEHAEQAYRDEQKIIRTGKPLLEITEKETFPDGTCRWVLTSKMPLRDEDQKIIGTMGISKNITRLIEAEEALRRARDEALAASRAKTQFLANISHELRTPIHTMIAAVEILLRKGLSSEQRQYLERIQNSATVLLGHVDEILDMIRLDSTKMQLNPRPFDLEETVERAAEFLAQSAQRKGLELICEIERRFPRLVGDASRLRQVVLNLLTNAVKYTEQGEIRLRLELLHEGSRSVRFRCAVEDTGVGIPKEKQRAIFEAFQQADASDARAHQGLGLGLAIAQGIVKLMGGEIRLESEKGRGSRFWFDLDLPVAPDPKPSPPPLWKGFSALVVDDHPGSRRALAFLARRCGLRVEEAGDVGHAIMKIQEAEQAKAPYWVVFVDEGLSGVKGEEFARTLCKTNKRPPRVVLLLSSMRSWDRLEPEAESGVWRCLLKPPPRSQVENLLRELIAPCPLPGAEGEAFALGPPPRRLRILVAEDNATNRFFAVKQLEILGHASEEAASGREALEALDKGRFDAVLLDCQMPEMDGYAVAREIRAREAARGLPRIPIVALTANAMETGRQAALRAGMDGYLAKPITLEKLRAALDRHVFGVASDSGVGSTESTLEPPRADSEKGASEALPLLDPTNLSLHGLGRDLGPEARWRRLLRLFIEEEAAGASRVAQAAQAGDLEAAGREAHKLKGASLSVGTKRLAEAAARAEAAANAGDRALLAGLLPALEAASRETFSLVNRLLENPAAALDFDTLRRDG